MEVCGTNIKTISAFGYTVRNTVEMYGGLNVSNCGAEKQSTAENKVKSKIQKNVMKTKIK